MSLNNYYCPKPQLMERGQNSLTLFGGVWCPSNKTTHILDEIRHIRENYEFEDEINWNESDFTSLGFYSNLADFIFKNEYLFFRCLVVKNSRQMRKTLPGSERADDFYRKMFHYMLKPVVNPVPEVDNSFNIYVENIETNLENLHESLCDKFHDPYRNVIRKIEMVKPEDSELIALTNFLTGIVGYYNLHLKDIPVKSAIVKHIRDKWKIDLDYTTAFFKKKFNIFVLDPMKDYDI